MVQKWSIRGMPHFLRRRDPGCCRHETRRNRRTEDIILRAPIASPRVATKWRVTGLSSVQRRVTPWRELTRHCSLRPGGASLQAETGRSEQGDVRSRSRWPRLVPPPPLFHRTHGLRGRALGCSRQGEGCTIEVDSSSLTAEVGPLYLDDHPRGPRRAGDKPIPIIHRPTPCTPAAGHAKRQLPASPARRHRRVRADLGQPARPPARLGRPRPRGPLRGPWGLAEYENGCR